MILILLLNIILATYVSYKVYKTFFYKAISPIIVIPITFILIESFFIMKTLEYLLNTSLPSFLNILAFHIMAIAIILLLLFTIFDILSIFKVQKKFKINPKLVIPILTLILYVYGYWNNANFIITEYTVYTDKNIPRDLKLILIADMHIDPSVTTNKIKKYADTINSINADLVLFPGDIIDTDIADLTYNKKVELRKIIAPVYASIGNHEYYSQAKEIIVVEIESAGINLLIDTFVSIDNLSLNIIGRDILIAQSISNIASTSNREDLSKIIAPIDNNYLNIVIDHIPTDESIASARDNNIDLLLSGHTHAGQFFPVNLIVKFMYQNAYGLKQYDNTTQIVTSGIRLWGPSIRIGTNSEIVVINIIKK